MFILIYSRQRAGKCRIMQTILAENVSSVVLAETILELYRWVWPLCLELSKRSLSIKRVGYTMSDMLIPVELHVITAWNNYHRLGEGESSI